MCLLKAEGVRNGSKELMEKVKIVDRLKGKFGGCQRWVPFVTIVRSSNIRVS